ncbi:MAG: M23 family metallopeptidase [Phyllobacteriaceae bacterium]|nr:M23 family metallopeptidase [Phyllobacteriaceae bacterium]
MSPTEERSRPFGRRSDLHRITIVHGDRVRAFHVDTRRLAAGAIVVGAFLASYLAATGWLFVRDDLIADQLGRQVRTERIYEDRVAALRAEIDRINGRQLIDQDAFEAKVDELLARQAKLGERQAKLGGLVTKIGELGLAIPSPKGPALAPIGAPLAPTPAAHDAAPAPTPLDTDRFAAPLRTSRLSVPAGRDGEGRDPTRRIAAAERAIAGFEKQQDAAIAGLAELAEDRGRSWTRALAKVGFKVAEPVPHPLPKPNDDAVGGPFVPVPLDGIGRAESALARLARLHTAAQRLPLARPLDGERTITSEFGVRTDPFLGIGAMHTGLDFRAEVGDSVHSTGPGRVIGAGRQGGYGLCVDVDHGNGVVTRYGHLSSITVTVGDEVKAGSQLGLAGSTGRSTGPHLHYETRVAGEPVDPRDWLDAGRALGF